MEEKEFRKDLYYRLQSHHIHIPPLREHPDDIPLLLDHFLIKAGEMLGKKPPTSPEELVTLLKSYHFPGNIRELEGMISDAVSRHNKGILSTQTFRDKMGGLKTQDSPTANTLSLGKTITFHGPMPTLKEMEKFLIGKALETSNGNQTIAAGLLGISRKALNNRLIRGKT